MTGWSYIVSDSSQRCNKLGSQEILMTANVKVKKNTEEGRELWGHKIFLVGFQRFQNQNVFQKVLNNFNCLPPPMPHLGCPYHCLAVCLIVDLDFIECPKQFHQESKLESWSWSKWSPMFGSHSLQHFNHRMGCGASQCWSIFDNCTFII